MVDTNFTLVSGTYVDEQHLLSELDFFMVNTIGGWTRVKTVTDTPGVDKNIAYYTDGSTSGTVYDRFWLRIRATAGTLRFNGMSNFDLNTDTDFDQFGGTEASTEMTILGNGDYWFAANKDAVHVVVYRTGARSHGGFGHFISYFTPEYDPKPFYIFGQADSTETFAAGTRLMAYGPHSWGTSYTPTNSGVSYLYEATHPAEIIHGSPNPRSGEPKLVEPVFFTDTAFGSYEVRGEVPGLYMGGYGVGVGSLINISKDPVTVSGSYLAHSTGVDFNAWVIGPVTVSGEG